MTENDATDPGSGSPTYRSLIEARTMDGAPCNLVVDRATYARSPEHGVLVSWHGTREVTAVLTGLQVLELHEALRKAA